MGLEIVAAGDAETPIDRFYGALERGDVVAARACCTADVVFWHSFDQTPQGLDEAARGWEQLFVAFPERRFVDIRRSATRDGFVQQQLMIARLATGAMKAWPVCLVVTIDNGLVARMEEYIDRTGSYMVTHYDDATPGLPPPATLMASIT